MSSRLDDCVGTMARSEAVAASNNQSTWTNWSEPGCTLITVGVTVLMSTSCTESTLMGTPSSGPIRSSSLKYSSGACITSTCFRSTICSASRRSHVELSDVVLVSTWAVGAGGVAGRCGITRCVAGGSGSSSSGSCSGSRSDGWRRQRQSHRRRCRAYLHMLGLDLLNQPKHMLHLPHKLVALILIRA